MPVTPSRANEKTEVTIRHADLMGVPASFRQPESEVARHPRAALITRYTVAKAQTRLVCNEQRGRLSALAGSAGLSCLEHHHWRASCRRQQARVTMSCGYAAAPRQSPEFISLKSRRFPPDLKSLTAYKAAWYREAPFLIGGNPGAGNPRWLQTLCNRPSR